MEPGIARVGAAIGNTSRTRILVALLGGQVLTASALAAESGVSAATVSAHLARLVNDGLISVERRGRNRYFRLANNSVAELLAVMARIAPPSPVQSPQHSTKAAALRRARVCHGHIAGDVGVAIMRSFLDQGFIVDQWDGLPAGQARAAPSEARYHLTSHGRAELARLRLPGLAWPAQEHVGYCLDWSQHERHHLAGLLGSALFTCLVRRGSLRRPTRSRVLIITDACLADLHNLFGTTLCTPT